MRGGEATGDSGVGLGCGEDVGEQGAGVEGHEVEVVFDVSEGFGVGCVC